MNILGQQTAYHIGELSEVSSARRAGNALSLKLGFDEIQSGRLALLITEAGTNIGKHAKRGQIFMRSLSRNGLNGIEIIAVDSGPGMFNPTKSFEDGYSTTETYGVGLGAIKRLAHEVDIYSESGKGTVLLMVIWNTEAQVIPGQWQIGSMCIPIANERVCGDSWIAVDGQRMLTVLVADGLGHGPDAAHASLLAVSVLEQAPANLPSETLQKSHQLMKGSRGAAVAVARVDLDTAELRYTGVGNISGCIYNHKSRQHLLSHNGIVGSHMSRTKEFTHAWCEDSMLVMHSDGVGTKWDINNYAGLENCHPSVIAAVLHRDHTRVRDDSTIVVIKRAQIACQ